ncbi:MAG: serine hydroxymethyltransferase [Gammaproteobacteria bacterium]
MTTKARYAGTTPIADYDPELAQAIAGEKKRQECYLELIASENYASPRVLEAQGSVLTNKYAEGYPGHRYYGGCEFVDQAETLAIERAKRLFGAAYVNVQPHSGSQANAATYLALARPGDRIVGMSLAHGGHLTHGAKVNFSGKFFEATQYGIDPDTALIDYDAVEKLVEHEKPKLLIAGFSAYSRIIDWAAFRTIADRVGAYLIVDMAHVAGLVAAGLYPNPIPHADVVTSTTHKTLRGPRGGLILARDNPEITKKLSAMVFPGTQGGPLMHVIAAKAVAFREALEPEFRMYQAQVVANARTMADAFMKRGLRVVSGGTDNHLLLLDLIGHPLTGQEAEHRLESIHITVNKNAVPNDPRPPRITSGLRIGSPAMTTRGLGTEESRWVAETIAECLSGAADNPHLESLRAAVLQLCQRFPVYG